MHINKYFRSVITLLTLVACSLSATAQVITPPPTLPSFSRTVSGIISLDKGIAKENYSVEIILTKRSFRFRGAPFFTISYPIERTYRTTVTIAKGRSSASYRVRNVSTIGFNKFAIELNCNACGSVVANQYFTPSGNQYRFSNSVILDLEEVPNRLNLTLNTGFSVFGTISLKDGEPAPRDLKLLIIASPTNDRSVLLQSAEIIIPSGETSFNYQLGGINPEIGGQLEIGLVCENCDGIAPEFTPLRRLLPLKQDNFDVNFILKKNINISSIINLLLND